MSKSRQEYDYWKMVKRTSFLKRYRKGKLTIVLNTHVGLERNNMRADSLRNHASSIEKFTVLLPKLDTTNLSE